MISPRILLASTLFSLLLGGCGGEDQSRKKRDDTSRAVPGSTSDPDTVVATPRSSGREPVRGKRFMVSSASAEATEAGLEVLRRGGNAVDAAVAVGFALSVTYPPAGNLGGGGFMVIRFPDGKTTTIDYRERAPAAARRDMYLDREGNFVPDRAQIGALAAGVPGSPAGMLHALERYGTLDRRAVLDPAVRLARDGFRVNEELAGEMAEKIDDFRRFPSTRRVFTLNDSISLSTGTRLRQPDLAATLSLIVEQGRDGFYRGRTADLIVAEMKRSGGIISHRDLQSYQPRERPAVIGTYRGDTVISMPPPSSGGVLLVQMLNMLEGWSFDSIPNHSARHAQVLAEVMRRAYADRATYLGDPDFVSVPRSLTAKGYALARAATITGRATPSDSVAAGNPAALRRESDQTTHYSVVDASGMCVSVTTTLNSSFGNKLVVDSAGFFLNNEMDDFSAKPGVPNIYGLVGGSANAVEPGKRMLSSMTPTIVARRDGSLLVLGTPGGSTIITTVLQVMQNVLDYGMSLPDAVELPRLHHQWRPDTLFYERDGLSPGTVDTLRSLGYIPLQRGGTSGRVNAIILRRDSAGSRLEGWSDSRGSGRAGGE